MGRTGASATDSSACRAAQDQSSSNRDGRKRQGEPRGRRSHTEGDTAGDTAGDTLTGDRVVGQKGLDDSHGPVKRDRLRAWRCPYGDVSARKGPTVTLRQQGVGSRNGASFARTWCCASVQVLGNGDEDPAVLHAGAHDPRARRSIVCHVQGQDATRASADKNGCMSGTARWYGREAGGQTYLAPRPSSSGKKVAAASGTSTNRWAAAS